MLYIKSFFEEGPGGAVVGDAVAAGEGGFVGYLAASVEFAGEGVGVGFASLHGTDLVPCGAVNTYAYKSF